MIYTSTHTCWSCSYPIISFRIHIFSLPFKLQIVWTWSWSLFRYFLFAWTTILEFSVRSESIEYLFIFFTSFQVLSGHYSIESDIPSWYRSMCSWGWFNWSSFSKLITLFFMFFNPKLMICFVDFYMIYLKMRMISHSWMPAWKIF